MGRWGPRCRWWRRSRRGTAEPLRAQRLLHRADVPGRAPGLSVCQQSTGCRTCRARTTGAGSERRAGGHRRPHRGRAASGRRERDRAGPRPAPVARRPVERRGCVSTRLREQDGLHLDGRDTGPSSGASAFSGHRPPARRHLQRATPPGWGTRTRTSSRLAPSRAPSARFALGIGPARSRRAGDLVAFSRDTGFGSRVDLHLGPARLRGLREGDKACAPSLRLRSHAAVRPLGRLRVLPAGGRRRRHTTVTRERDAAEQLRATGTWRDPKLCRDVRRPRGSRSRRTIRP
jgi:hypothetical protein